jgi:tagatose 1,6-diphosphate aldolase
VTGLAKARGLARISDGQGRYAILAIDQRPPFFGLIGRALGRPDDAVAAETGELKALLAATLASEVSGLLVDPLYGYRPVLPVLPRHVGLLLTLEHHVFETLAPGYRVSQLIPRWGVPAAVRAGAEALKLLIYYRPDAPEDVRARQRTLVREVGGACRDADRPFVLEILPYRLPGEATDTYARGLPALSSAVAEAFADPSYGVDLYKLALPGDLDGVREWGGSLYSLQDLTAVMERLARLLPAPWVLLSGGMPPERFVAALQAALAGGARGYLAGRAVWWGPIQAYPDLEAVRQNLLTQGVSVLRALNAELARIPAVTNSSPASASTPSTGARES